jgi:hypothetical protein
LSSLNVPFILGCGWLAASPNFEGSVYAFFQKFTMQGHRNHISLHIRAGRDRKGEGRKGYLAADWLVGCLVDWLVGWLVNGLETEGKARGGKGRTGDNTLVVCWFVGAWLAGKATGAWLVGGFVCLLAQLWVGLVGWLTICLLISHSSRCMVNLRLHLHLFVCDEQKPGTPHIPINCRSYIRI